MILLIGSKKYLGVNPEYMMAFNRISEHYKLAINAVFDYNQYKYIIILEDDLVLSIDFIQYMMSLRKLMEIDKTIGIISAWNDYGKKHLINDNKRLYRSDCFSGLGWMISKEIWLNVADIWPDKFWDDWLRIKLLYMNIVTVFPEVSRVSNIGYNGSSGSEFYTKHVKTIEFNEEFINFDQMDLSYLIKDSYDIKLHNDISSATEISFEQIKSDPFIIEKQPIESHFKTILSMYKISKLLEYYNVVHEPRSNLLFRCSYKDTITLKINNRYLHILINKFLF